MAQGRHSVASPDIWFVDLIEIDSFDCSVVASRRTGFPGKFRGYHAKAKGEFAIEGCDVAGSAFSGRFR